VIPENDMLTINPTSARGALNDTASPPAEGSAMGADPAGFASLLRQTQAATAPPPPAFMTPATPPVAAAEARPAATEPAAHSNDEAASEPQEAQAPQESDPGSRARALLKGKWRAADGTGPTARGGKPDARTSDAPKAGASDAANTEKRSDAAPTPTGAEPALDPGVMHWLAALQQRTAAPAGELAKGTKDTKDTKNSATDAAAPASVGDDSAARAPGRSSGPTAAELKADADLKDQAAQGRAQRAAASETGLFAQALAAQAPAEKTPASPPTTVTGSKDAAALSAASLAPAPGAASDIAAPVAVVVATPVNAPDFAQELGLKLSLLARDGVQQAELHLNPADMGPVSVQIVMDGTQARVDFGADMAATRQAIEAGLPELASALRDAGFTLAGGGVSQHGGGRGDGDGNNAGADPGRRRSADAATVQHVATAARRIVNAGGVDLFA
jgi:flagellar hook-length control protein FliK